MSAKPQVAVDASLFTWPSPDPRLIGSACQDCGNVEFPVRKGCTSCCSTNVQDTELASRGTLWTWTTQNFLPKNPPYSGPETPETFKPYGVGYIELPGQVRVESRLQCDDLSQLKIGMEMELVIEKFIENDKGEEVMIFMFKPVLEGES